MKTPLLLTVVLSISLAGFAQTTKARRADGTECAALPCVVASVSLTDQTSAITRTALITPTAGALFRVTYYLESSHVKGSTWGVAFGWIDDLKTWSTGTFQAHAGQVSSLAFNFRVVAGQPITYSVTQGTNNPPGTTYDLFITVEQLQ